MLHVTLILSVRNLQLDLRRDQTLLLGNMRSDRRELTRARLSSRLRWSLWCSDRLDGSLAMGTPPANCWANVGREHDMRITRLHERRSPLSV